MDAVRVEGASFRYRGAQALVTALPPQDLPSPQSGLLGPAVLGGEGRAPGPQGLLSGLGPPTSLSAPPQTRGLTAAPRMPQPDRSYLRVLFSAQWRLAVA